MNKVEARIERIEKRIERINQAEKDFKNGRYKKHPKPDLAKKVAEQRLSECKLEREELQVELAALKIRRERLKQ